MERFLESEWLDELPAGDARAMRSRQDLRRLNSLLGHVGVMTQLLRQANLGRRECLLADLGAGDGWFALKLIGNLAPHVQVRTVILVDRLSLLGSKTAEGFARLGCKVETIRADVLAWLAEAPPLTVITANLFLHHVADGDLARLFNLAAERSEAFVACEPRRSWAGLTGSHLLGLIGCGAVTRHDALASVRAGFMGQELSRLWPQSSRWLLKERSASLFTHSFLARRAETE